MNNFTPFPDYRYGSIKLNPNLTNYELQRILDFMEIKPNITLVPDLVQPKVNVQKPEIEKEETIIKTLVPSTKCSTRKVFQVVYGKYKPNKKNKNWTYDGFVNITSTHVTLFNEDGTRKGSIERAHNHGINVFPKSGDRIIISGFECELIDEVVDINQFDSGKCFTSNDEF
ncbi:DNA repair and recombination protein rad54b [Blomia tropicalis]|nr:DNA repair and recombination protein rad54b [Blomia tropicalis]